MMFVVAAALPFNVPNRTPFASTVAAEVLSDDQLTKELRFEVVPSEKVPIAVKEDVVPVINLVLGAKITSVCKLALLTVKASDCAPVLALPKLAWICATPGACAVTTPLMTVATAVASDVQTTDPVIFCVVPS